MAVTPKDKATKSAESGPKADKPKATRKMPTAAERVAKLEADLAAARERANAKANKETDVKRTRLASLKQRRDKIQAEIDLLTEQVGDPSETGVEDEPASDDSTTASDE